MLTKTLFSFLLQHHHSEKPLLLGLSGGPDSLALFHLLLKYRSQYGLKMGIAHVNHNWRPESGLEATQLQALAEKEAIPFHLKLLDPNTLEGNLEAACRQQRLDFFSTLCKKYGYQAVLLGHHADDLAETVLKRILEGAALQHLSPLQSIQHIEGLTIWRPFLSLTKKDIVNWVEQQALIPFHDRSNLDPKYLRARFRKDILPFLEENFGKQIHTSICQIADQAAELKSYLQQNLKDYLKQIYKSKWGTLLDFSHHCPHPFLMKYLLKEIASQEGYCLSRAVLDTAAQLVLEGKANKQIVVGNLILQIDRKHIIFTTNNHHLPTTPIDLPHGVIQYGAWKVTVSECTVPQNQEPTLGWKRLWNNQKWELFLPLADYQLGPVVLNEKLDKLWSDAKVPAFLRRITPVLWKEGKFYREFLTERASNCIQGPCLKIILE